MKLSIRAHVEARLVVANLMHILVVANCENLLLMQLVTMTTCFLVLSHLHSHRAHAGSPSLH